jgi:hypothetical protein
VPLCDPLRSITDKPLFRVERAKRKGLPKEALDLH